MARVFCALLAGVALAAALSGAPAADVVLTARMHHLRIGVVREWDEFPEQAEGAALVLPFDATASAGERTVRLRHRDVKQSWCVQVNGREIACLPPDEADTISYLAIPPGRADGRPQRAAESPAAGPGRTTC